MTLAEWMSQQGLTEAQAALRFGVTQAAVNKYRRRLRIPRPAVMRRIAEVTGGAVTPNDFHQAAQPTAPSEEIAA